MVDRRLRSRLRQPAGLTLADEIAGAAEPYEDAALYDWEYRRRRKDIAFYRMLAREQGGPVLDLACGTGRLLTAFAREDLAVVGFDRSAAMLARARVRAARLSRHRRGRVMLVRADLRNFPLRTLPLRHRFRLVVAAFHSVQHLVDDHDLVQLFKEARRCLAPGGWLAFDLFSPSAAWLARPPSQNSGQTRFTHPTTGVKTTYSVSHVYDPGRRALHMRVAYQKLDSGGRKRGRAQIRRLCHRQLAPVELEALLRHARLRILRRWADFELTPLSDSGTESEQHVYLVGRDS